MAAYVIVQTEVTDPEKIKQYQALAPDIVARFGGRYLVRGGEMAVLEGDWTPPRLVVLEFPSLAKAKEFYNSPEYQEAVRVRTGAANFQMVAVEGI